MGTMNTSIPDELLARIDSVVSRGHYSSRSELIRDSLRHFLDHLELGANVNGAVLGAITTTYDFKRRGISDEIVKLRHFYEDIVLTSVDEDLHEVCMEIILARGDAKRVKELVDNLRAVRGVESVEANFLLAPVGKH